MHSEQNGHDAPILGDCFVKAAKSGSVEVGQRFVHNVAVPQSVVGSDEAAFAKLRKNRLEIVDVLSLIGVHKHEVERTVKPGNGVQRGTEFDCDPIGVWAGRNVLAGYGHMPGVGFARYDMTAGREFGSHRQ